MPDQPRPRSYRVKYGLTALVVAAPFLALMIYQAYTSHQIAENSARTNARNLALVLESKLEGDFDAAQRAISAMVAEIEPDALRADRVDFYRREISSKLMSRIQYVSSAAALRVFDAKGDRLYSSIDGEPPLNIADRAYFKTLRDGPLNDAVFSEVAMGRPSGRVQLYVGKAIRDRDGTFRGAVVTVISLVAIHERFSHIELGKGGVIALRRLGNGALVVRYPGAVVVDNTPAPTLPVLKALVDVGPSGAFQALSPVDGLRRTYGYQTIGKHPFFVLVGIAEDDYLAEWRRNAFKSLVASLIFLGTVGAVLHRLALAGEQLRIAATAFESREGTVVTDADTVILRVNRAFTELTGYTAEDVVGLTPRLLKSDRHGDDFYRQMWATIKRTGGWQGEIWDRRKDGSVFPKWLTISAVKDSGGAVTHYIGMQYDITERKDAEQRIQTLAYFDQLTNLPNRTLLLDRLKQATAAGSRNGDHGALLFIDLDNFKTLNDTLGHDVGDKLLKQVSARLLACVREGDTVARLGGDEFVVVLAGLKASEADAAIGAEKVASKILASLNVAYRLGEVEHRSTASIGLTLFADDHISVDDLMKQADLAMYQAKETGRNAWRFFDVRMEHSVKERVALEDDLRHAIVSGQFLLYYQPQVVDQGRLTGAEALVRWRHPARGMVSPADFIPLAEKTGLILPLGQWVLETACRQLAAWASRPETAHLTMAVNVSAHQFRQADFVNQVLAVLGGTAADPRRLKLELTESLLVENVQDVVDKMCALKAVGVGFALDDFGTGYSSLSYLKRLPLDQLKIDQSFVRDGLTDVNDAAIARTIVALARSLGLEVIAEGVETEAQMLVLASHGCHDYQGFFFSRPLPLDGFEAFVRGGPEGGGG